MRDFGDLEIAACRAIGRRNAQAAGRNTQPQPFRRDRMVVRAVNGAALDVDGGTEAVPMRLTSVPMTTACKGVKVGDVVVVDTYMHKPLVVGVLAR